MTPATEKAAPIPAEVLALARLASIEIGEWVVDRSRKHPRDIVADLLLADREARPSLPDKRQEQIRAEASEDERDRLRLLAHQEAFEAESPACRRLYLIEAWLSEKGGQLPAERSRLRGEVS